MKDMLIVEEFFNKEFNFNELKQESTIYVKKILKEADNNFYEDYGSNEQEILQLRNMRVEYDSTKLIINCEGTNPIFLIKFNLYKGMDSYPNYIYELEYNMNGNFLDEYFLKY